jgi:hypothetical protein
MRIHADQDTQHWYKATNTLVLAQGKFSQPHIHTVHHGKVAKIRIKKNCYDAYSIVGTPESIEINKELFLIIPFQSNE